MAAPAKRKTPEDPKQRKLTPAQALFADYVISGKMKTEAYRQAYPNASLSTGALQVEASRTAALPHVAEYIANALAERRKEVLLTRDMKRQRLGRIVLTSRNDIAVIHAIKTDNEMTGDNAPVRVEGEITLHAIFTAMAKTTGLPSAHEQAVIEVAATPALPAGTVPLPPDEHDELVPAMERRKQA